MVTRTEIPEGYKLTEVGVIPEDWDVKKLDECCKKITDGTHDTPKPVKNGIPFLTAIHVKENCIDFKNCYYLPKCIHEIIYKRCNPEVNDVLMVNIGAGVSTTALVEVDYEFSLKNVALLKPDNAKLIGSYLNYYQSFQKDKIVSSLSSGGAQPFLSLGQISNLQIALPSITEQQFIAEPLSDIDGIIASLDELITKQQNIEQGTMQQLLSGKKRLFGFSGEWEIKKLGEIANFFKGKGLPKSELTVDGKYRCIHYGELFTKYNQIIREVNCSTNQNICSFLSKCNDVLMPTSDVTPNGLATASCIKEDNIILGGDILVIRIPELVMDGIFLSYCITKNREQIMQLVSGSTVYHLYASDMKEFQLNIPPIEEQIAIIKVISDMDSEIKSLEQKRDKFKSIKQGMMQELLTGKTRLV